jgi:hypothetical protein
LYCQNYEIATLKRYPQQYTKISVNSKESIPLCFHHDEYDIDYLNAEVLLQKNYASLKTRNPVICGKFKGILQSQDILF